MVSIIPIQLRYILTASTGPVLTTIGLTQICLGAALSICYNKQLVWYVKELKKSLRSARAPASIWVRIVVDGAYNSSMYVCSTGPPASGTYKISGHIEFLTDSLNSGLHTVNVQFFREVGSPTILARTLTVFEISA
ncbi:hypothetical protein KAT21_04420 [Candidatus Bathyarchaeota archaeon]|nr:hypothetical protein [Candidatus Bathyarchaeota archaeon]